MFTFIFNDKKKIVLVVGLGVIILILVLVQALSTTQSPSELVTSPPPSFSPQPLNNLPSSAPSDREVEKTTSYQIDNLKKDYERILTHQPLSDPDQTIRENLITSLNNQSGILSQTSDFKIEYVKAPNSFMIEILSNDTEKAKTNAQDWFKQKGLSSSGICNLPVVFYISRTVSDYLIANKLEFNPIPSGCQ